MKSSTVDRLNAAVTFLLVVSAIVLVWSLFLVARATDGLEVPAAPLDPIVALAGRLGAGSALIFLLTETAKKKLAWFKSDQRVFGLAVLLGLVVGLGHVVEPTPSHLPLIGEIFSGLGATAIAVTVHSGRRARRG